MCELFVIIFRKHTVNLGICILKIFFFIFQNTFWYLMAGMKRRAVSTQHRSQNITDLPVSHTSFLATIHMLSRTAAHDAVSMLDVRT